MYVCVGGCLCVFIYTVLGVTHFQVTSKVTHYFLIYKKISELLFQKSNASYFDLPFIDWQVSCPHVGRNQKYRGVVWAVNMLL